jgi:hypothetical protein
MRIWDHLKARSSARISLRNYYKGVRSRFARREPETRGGDPMSPNGLDVFDTTLQKTNAWLKELMEELAWDDRHRAYTLLESRVSDGEIADVKHVLPSEIRDLWP